MLGLTAEQLQAIDRLFTDEPSVPAKAKDWHTKALIMLYQKFFGENASASDYTFLCKVRDGKTKLDDSNFWSMWHPAYWKLRNRFGATRDRRTEMSDRAGRLGGGTAETIYRDCCADEATSAQNTDALSQHKDSFDKFKWIFVDTANTPIQSKDPDYRLTISVKSGTLKLLNDLAVQHVGTVDSCVVSRCHTRLAAKGITVDQTVPNEVGSFAIHVDVLDIFCNLAVTGIVKTAKK